VTKKNSKGNKEDEGGKGDGDGGYGDDVERDHRSSNDSKWQQRRHKSTQHNNQPKATMESTRAVTTQAAKARARMVNVCLVGLPPRIGQR
jgi:hypothetical protein